MFLVRDIMYCKPGQARPMVQKFLALGKLGQKMGFGSMRVMTDVSAERYWTVVTEMEVESLEKFGAHLARLGIKYSDGPHLKPDGGGIAFIDAPEGYEVELIQMAKEGAGY